MPPFRAFPSSDEQDNIITNATAPSTGERSLFSYAVERRNGFGRECYALLFLAFRRAGLEQLERRTRSLCTGCFASLGDQLRATSHLVTARNLPTALLFCKRCCFRLGCGRHHDLPAWLPSEDQLCGLDSAGGGKLECRQHTAQRSSGCDKNGPRSSRNGSTPRASLIPRLRIGHGIARRCNSSGTRN